MVPLCKEIARMVAENHELKENAASLEEKLKTTSIQLKNSRPIRDAVYYLLCGHNPFLYFFCTKYTDLTMLYYKQRLD